MMTSSFSTTTTKGARGGSSASATQRSLLLLLILLAAVWRNEAATHRFSIRGGMLSSKGGSLVNMPITFNLVIQCGLVEVYTGETLGGYCFETPIEFDAGDGPISMTFSVPEQTVQVVSSSSQQQTDVHVTAQSIGSIHVAHGVEGVERAINQQVNGKFQLVPRGRSFGINFSAQVTRTLKDASAYGGPGWTPRQV